MRELILHAPGHGSALARNTSPSNSPSRKKPGPGAAGLSAQAEVFSSWLLGRDAQKLEKKQPAPFFGKEEIAL